jgi:hypothetical protein
MGAEIQFRRDLQAFEYEHAGDVRSVMLKDFASTKYHYLSEYEYRLLRMLDGERTLEAVTDRLAKGGRRYTIEEARAITAKAAQLGLMVCSPLETTQGRSKQSAEIGKKGRQAGFSTADFLHIPFLYRNKILARALRLLEFIGSKVFAVLFTASDASRIFIPDPCRSPRPVQGAAGSPSAQ